MPAAATAAVSFYLLRVKVIIVAFRAQIMGTQGIHLRNSRHIGHKGAPDRPSRPHQITVLHGLPHQFLGNDIHHRKAVLDKWAESGRIQKLRSLLREIGNAHDTVIFDTDAEGITVIYAEPVEFAGTKKEFLQHLWDECAERVCRFDDRDCTGQRFTTNYKVGYLGNNLWRVAESFGYDF